MSRHKATSTAVRSGTHRAERRSLRKSVAPGSALRVVTGTAVVGVALAGGLASANQPTHSAVAVAGSTSGLLDAAVQGPAEVASSVDPRQRQSVSRSASRNQLQVAAEGRLLRDRRDALARLDVLATRHEDDHEARQQWVRPLTSYRVTATFGQSSYLWSTVHTGIDLAAPTGTSVGAVGAGVVISASYDGSYGNKVVVRHDDGTETWYAHMNTIESQVGQAVEAGTLIGTVGSTGNVTGPHLHLEVRPGGGEPVDPGAAFMTRGLPL